MKLEQTGMRSWKVYRHFFHCALRDVRQHIADFEAEVAEWYETGDGRRVSEGGRGYRFPHCIHGTSTWTDYDNICGACEDSITPIQEAQAVAREQFRRFNDRWDWYNSAPADAFPRFDREAMVNYVFELFPEGGD